jgi:dTDP-4-dehydrorhamnose reductase
MIHFSTDYVFDGKKNEPYNEKDEAKPLSVYGESKLEGEEAVLAIDDQNLVVRVSWVFGPERSSFIDHMIKRARDIELVEAVADKFSTPTYTRDISQMLHPMLESLAARNDSDAGQDSTHVYHGVLHFANSGACSWQEYAQYGLDCCHQLGIPLKASKVRPIHLADMTNWVARRPVHSVLSTAKYSSLAGTPPRSWREALAQYIASFYFSLKDSRA